MLTVSDLLIIGVALIALVVGLVALVRSGKSPDAALVIKLQEFEARTDVMDKLESAYFNATGIQRDAVDTLRDVLEFVAPRTIWKADDELLETLKHIMDGKPNEPPLTEDDTKPFPPSLG